MALRISRRLALSLALGLVSLGVTLHLVLKARTRRALEGQTSGIRPLAFVPLPAPRAPLATWGSGDVEAVAALGGELFTAGGFGLEGVGGPLGAGLPTQRVVAMTLWRGRPVVGLASGGLFLRRGTAWEEAKTGFGTLHVRALAETPGGELWIGAQEGLFRTAWGEPNLERFDADPVRALALGEGGLCLAGGEKGLRRVEGKRLQALPTPDPWVDWVGWTGREVAVLTPLGLSLGPLDGSLMPVRGAQEARQAACFGGEVFAVAAPGLLRVGGTGRTTQESLPDLPRRVFAVEGALLVDTPSGLLLKRPEGWRRLRPRPQALPPGPSHVNALAHQGGRLVVGLFDGGLAVGEPRGEGWTWRAVEGSATWGVNALLPTAGGLVVASLRGAARLEGNQLRSLPDAPTGSAHALAETKDGLVIGYGQGVLLGGTRMLSAFHGLPGNQALALLSGEPLLVGTPTGLGAIQGGKVLWRVVAGEDRLPHPWVTALARFGGAVGAEPPSPSGTSLAAPLESSQAIFIGTYGGGVTRRTQGPDPKGTYRDFPETRGFKVNQGCLVEAAGRLYLGTDGGGLHRLSADGQRFHPLSLPLPSPRITALLAGPDALYVGTDEGLCKVPFERLKEGN